jgi:hypothetical protein
LKGSLQPLQLTMFNHHHIKATWRPMSPSPQIVLSGKDDALLFAHADAAQGSAMALSGATAYFDENHSAAGLAHNQVYLAATPSWGAVIANQQLQTLFLQMRQGLVLGIVAQLLGGGPWCLSKGVH